MEKNIGKIPKNDFIDIVIQIDDFNNNTGVTIREFVKGDRYQGFTKSGTKIPANQIEQFKRMIASIKPEDLKSDNQKSLPANKSRNKIEESQEEDNTI